ncbi:hypothetical protein [Paracoccus jiaweipingae]|uniref:hypothetical protein n=1 Tax=unclassified Paracoccus (in: a-proteobacteria) TaxID=2688777 RepID=UPI0037B803AB
MRIHPLTPALALTLLLSGCGSFSGDSGLNPLGWFSGRDRGPETLAPKGGYPTTTADARQPIAHIASAVLKDVPDGKLLVVTGMAPTRGWWDAELVPELPQVAGRLRGDQDGILRLRFVAQAPYADSPDARVPANPNVDMITTALPISRITMAGLRGITVSGATQVITIRR